MSVLKTKRTLSPLEYVHSFLELSQYTNDRVMNLSKRRMYLGESIMEQMNQAYERLFTIAKLYNKNRQRLADQQDAAVDFINDLLSLQKPLLTWWNSIDTRSDQIKYWASLINREIELIYTIGKLGNRKMEDRIFILDKAQMKDAAFLNTMGSLHRIIHTKYIHMPKNIQTIKGDLLTTLVDEAFYRVCHANRRIPTTKEQYEERKTDLSLALQCLDQMQDPLLGIFNLISYSNETMIEITEKIVEETRLIKGIMKSDQRRFGNLI